MRFHTLRLSTHPLAQQRDFYTRVLEVPLSAATGGQFTLRAGATALTFAAAAPGAPAAYHFAFNIPPRQFAAAKGWLAARVPLLTDASGADEFHSPTWNAEMVYFADPAGNIGELIARHDLPAAAAGPFTGPSLLSVSEIGVVVDDVPAFAHTLEATLGAAVYRGTVDATFTPVGDEHGLLIVVRRGRPWFPDLTLAAVSAPLSLGLSDAAGRRWRIEGPPYQVAPG